MCRHAQARGPLRPGLGLILGGRWFGRRAGSKTARVALPGRGKNSASRSSRAKRKQRELRVKKSASRSSSRRCVVRASVRPSVRQSVRQKNHRNRATTTNTTTTTHPNTNPTTTNPPTNATTNDNHHHRRTHDHAPQPDTHHDHRHGTRPRTTKPKGPRKTNWTRGVTETGNRKGTPAMGSHRLSLFLRRWLSRSLAGVPGFRFSQHDPCQLLCVPWPLGVGWGKAWCGGTRNSSAVPVTRTHPRGMGEASASGEGGTHRPHRPSSFSMTRTHPRGMGEASASGVNETKRPCVRTCMDAGSRRGVIWSQRLGGRSLVWVTGFDRVVGQRDGISLP